MGHLTWPRPFEGRFAICRLAMLNPRITFEMSTITCNEEMKGNAKCKNSRLEPPFGGLRGNAQGSSVAQWKARCRLLIRDNWIFLASSHGCDTIKRNLSKSAFFDGGGSLWAQISGRWGRCPKCIYEPLDRGMMMPLEVFTQRNFAADFFRRNLKFTGKK